MNALSAYSCSSSSARSAPCERWATASGSPSSSDAYLQSSMPLQYVSASADDCHRRGQGMACSGMSSNQHGLTCPRCYRARLHPVPVALCQSAPHACPCSCLCAGARFALPDPSQTYRSCFDQVREHMHCQCRPECSHQPTVVTSWGPAGPPERSWTSLPAARNGQACGSSSIQCWATDVRAHPRLLEPTAW